MDTNMLLLAIVIILAVVAVIGFFMFRQRSSVSIKGPMGTGLEMQGSNEEPLAPPARPAIETGNISGGKDVKVRDETERGIQTVISSPARM